MKQPLRIYPQSTADLAETISRAEFLDTLGAPVLLVRLDNSDWADLAHALIASLSAMSLPIVPSLGFHTVRQPHGAASSVTPASLRLESHYVRVRARLTSHEHVVVPLRKREIGGKAFSARISVGRAVNNDIVLRHESTSKFHAWLEADDDGAFYVSDASSRNGTFVNEVRVPARSSALVDLGAELRFAAITTLMCAAGTLWDAVRGGE